MKNKESSTIIKKLEERADDKLIEYVYKSFAPSLKLLRDFKLSEEGLQLLKTSNLRNIAEIISIIFIEDIIEQKKIAYREEELNNFLKEHEKMIGYLKDLEK